MLPQSSRRRCCHQRYRRVVEGTDMEEVVNSIVVEVVLRVILWEISQKCVDEHAWVRIQFIKLEVDTGPEHSPQAQKLNVI